MVLSLALVSPVVNAAHTLYNINTVAASPAVYVMCDCTGYPYITVCIMLCYNVHRVRARVYVRRMGSAREQSEQIGIVKLLY